MTNLPRSKFSQLAFHSTVHTLRLPIEYDPKYSILYNVAASRSAGGGDLHRRGKGGAPREPSHVNLVLARQEFPVVPAHVEDGQVQGIDRQADGLGFARRQFHLFPRHQALRRLACIRRSAWWRGKRWNWQI